jgi:hypothetical protein
MSPLFQKLSGAAFGIFVFGVCGTHAHSGRTDSQGGHFNRASGEYHFHHGMGPHQHPGGKCPYQPGTQGEQKEPKAATPKNPHIIPTPPPQTLRAGIRPPGGVTNLSTNAIIVTASPPQRTNTNVEATSNDRQHELKLSDKAGGDVILESQKINAAKGFPEAQYALGVRYLNGLGVEKDAMKAHELFEKAAAHGNIKAKQMLKTMEAAADAP